MAKSSYFKWLVRKVANSKQAKKYSRLFETLYSVQFYCKLERDDNRIADAIELRAKFERENNVYIPGNCSFLEVLVALSVHCEERIMGDWDYGDRTSKWFWIMMDNSGLSDFEDACYDEFAVLDILNIILERKYYRDGSGGGLFYIPDTAKDLRKVELWIQLMWWLTRNED